MKVRRFGWHLWDIAVAIAACVLIAASADWRLATALFFLGVIGVSIRAWLWEDEKKNIDQGAFDPNYPDIGAWSEE